MSNPWFFMSFDLIHTLVLLGLAAVVTLLYFIRVATKGRVHYDRVDRQGGSALLSKDLMELGYWSLQPIARLLVFLKITPNMLSWSSLFLGLVAGICLAKGHFGSGAVFATASFLLDALDGMVARMTGSASPGGQVLDSALDRYVEFFFLGGLLIYYRHIPVMMIVTLAALLGSFMVSYSTAKAEAIQVTPPRGNMKRSERAFYLTLGAVLSPITIPWLEQVREFPIAIAHPMVVAICLVAVLANVSAAERFAAIARAAREKNSGAHRVLSETATDAEEEEESKHSHSFKTS